ncbi:MAG: homoserine kinase [Acidimicrobiia bacterium]
MIGSATAPASSGNLGPGFDALALAVDLWCRCEAERSDDWWIEEEGTRTRASHSDLAVRAVQHAVGDRPMTLRIGNDIPRSRGLGSSSAVRAAAAASAMRAVGIEPTDQGLFEIVSALEGHPDNAAAAVYGGLVIAYDGVVGRLPIAPELRVVLAIPDLRLSTHRARAALPGAVRHQVAARSIARVGMLLEGLRTGDPAMLDKATGDELHELPRRSLSPLTGRLIEAARAGGALHAAWSGAGPTVIAFATDATRSQVEAALSATLGDEGVTMHPDISDRGWS